MTAPGPAAAAIASASRRAKARRGKRVPVPPLTLAFTRSSSALNTGSASTATAFAAGGRPAMSRRERGQRRGGGQGHDLVLDDEGHRLVPGTGGRWKREGGKGHVLQGSVGDDDQPFPSQAVGHGREQHLAQRRRGPPVSDPPPKAAAGLEGPSRSGGEADSRTETRRAAASTASRGGSS